MKTLAFCSLLLLAIGCSSSSNTDLLDHRTLQCEAGDDLAIQAGLEAPTQSTNEAFTGSLTMLVNVTNNSHQDYTITAIRIDPAQSSNDSTYDLISAYQKVNQVIPENEEHLFRLPVSGRSRGSAFSREHGRQGVPFVLTVLASNGDQYRCQFSVPDPSF
ncbi:MAG: hypothetical protein JO197_22705 [Acidobacteria bacterium]|nr:hypothetical protein [Acidobacteriota bacterium]MBV9477982.1 hypothetical protein [Acidobacteriota bacterium]